MLFRSDPDFMEFKPDNFLNNQLTKKLADAIDPILANNDPAANTATPGTDTVYFCIVDQKGMAVSFINSIYKSFGSSITTEKSGICLQNRGACFVTEPGHPNCIGPSKRPRHTIIPALIPQNHQLAAVFGVMGGAYQPMGHQSVMVNRYIYNMDPQAALDFPRLFHQDGIVGTEQAVPAATVISLSEMGHKLERLHGPLGGGQFIQIRQENLIAGSDHRKDGFAAGF